MNYNEIHIECTFNAQGFTIKKINIKAFKIHEIYTQNTFYNINNQHMTAGQK